MAFSTTRMPGSTIASPSAGGWVTDFLNTAYFARPARQRDVDDLRLAFCVLTTRWARGGGRRLGAGDVRAFHRAFGRDRLHGHPHATLDRSALLEGAAALLGYWFPGAYADDDRRAHGIAFPSAPECAAFDPGLRLQNAALGSLTAPQARPAAQHWATYPPVRLASAPRTIAWLGRPERWPDAGAENGRFTALSPGGLTAQTFEIEVSTHPAPRAPLYTRGYVTVTRLLDRDADRADLDAHVAGLGAALERHGDYQPLPVPTGATAHLALELTTHAGHFLGAGRSHILVYEDGDGAWIRDVGVWDPLPWHLAGTYRLAGRAAQRAFWGTEPQEASMLAQIAVRTRPIG